MKEKEFISVIKEVLQSEYIGDDCAYLKDLGIVVTQDSLVENVHFRRDFMNPFELGYKSVAVNLSDVAASGAQAKYLTIALSLPSDIDNEFIKSFYEGAKFACGNDVKIVGGDITGADKVLVSVCAIGASAFRKVSSRKCAKVGYKVVVSGLHGSSAAGLRLLMQGKRQPKKFIDAHLMPKVQTEFAREISSSVKQDYAMMDTSDGLLDALSTIANESGVFLDIDFNKIPYDKDIEQFDFWQNMVLFGGEDYGIVAVVPQELDCGGVVVGEAKLGLGVNLRFSDNSVYYTKADVEKHIFEHFN